jgi:hypothetical protein
MFPIYILPIFFDIFRQARASVASRANQEAGSVADEALANLLETTSTTPAGAKALLDWIALNLARGDTWPTHHSHEIFELLKDSLAHFA